MVKNLETLHGLRSNEDDLLANDVYQLVDVPLKDSLYNKNSCPIY